MKPTWVKLLPVVPSDVNLISGVPSSFMDAHARPCDADRLRFSVTYHSASSVPEKPVIVYYWSPSGAVGKYNLKNVALPAPTVDCAAQGDKCDGDYPVDTLFKVASAKLEAKDARVFNFVKNFVLDNRAGQPELKAARKAAAAHPIEKVGAELRAMMPWIGANKLVDKAKN